MPGAGAKTSTCQVTNEMADDVLQALIYPINREG
jgi:hypothetical protein